MRSVALFLALAAGVAALLHAAHATAVGELPDGRSSTEPIAGTLTQPAGHQPTGQ